MISVEAQGLESAIAKMKKRAAALKDLTPPYKSFAAELVKKTDDGFQFSRSYDGEPFEPLAQSTIDKRVGALKSANKRGKSGKLTKGAQTMRAKLLAPGGIKPLVDTARARNSQHAEADKNGVEWGIVGYLGYSMSGTVRIPERNPTPFLYNEGSTPPWDLRKSARESLVKLIRKHVFGVDT